MAIDESGEWWVGDSPADIGEYLQAFSEENYPVELFRMANCSCGCSTFRIDFDNTENVVRRTCENCDLQHFVCDSDEFWDDASPEVWKCVGCASLRHHLGVGFALYHTKQDVHWLYVGVRCAKCGILACIADWKVGYGPSLQLIEQV